MKKLVLTATGAVVAFANSAFANADCTINPFAPGCVDPEKVPEISALEGTAAIAALAAIVLLTWERRRRAM